MIFTLDVHKREAPIDDRGFVNLAVTLCYSHEGS